MCGCVVWARKVLEQRLTVNFPEATFMCGCVVWARKVLE